jgi:hypothetical protein
MDTFTPLAVVNPDVLLLPPLELKLKAYPPRYTENDPPYTCAKTLHQRASHAQQQYDRGGDNRKSTHIGARWRSTRSFCGMNTSQRREMNTSGQRENARLAAAELANVELLMETTRPVTMVVPHTEETEEGDDPWNARELLEVYAPMYTALIDPPYELPPVVVALQLELFTLLMDTFMPLAVVNADALLLLLPKLKLQAYPPRYTENDPP